MKEESISVSLYHLTTGLANLNKKDKTRVVYMKSGSTHFAKKYKGKFEDQIKNTWYL